MKRLSTSEKVIVNLRRKDMTRAELAEKLGLTLMTINRRIESNAWRPVEIYYMTTALHFEL
jgi:DNA-binding XRE family transcriptional regulator